MGVGLRLLIRVKFLEPYFNVVSSECYKFIITRHGVVMIFFFLMPVLVGGFGNYLIPLIGGLPDLNLPRLKALSMWLLIPSMFFLILRLYFGAGLG